MKLEENLNSENLPCPECREIRNIILFLRSDKQEDVAFCRECADDLYKQLYTELYCS
jgi:hypothetical protein